MIASSWKRWSLAILLVVAYWKYRTEKKKKEAERRKRLIVLEEWVASKRYQGVAQAFRKNFEEGRESGAQLVCYAGGSKVLELYGGKDESRFFSKDKLAVIFSCTKVVESLIVAMLVDRGIICYEDPIAKHWPELGSKIGQQATVRDLMCHQAGVSGIHHPLPIKQGGPILSNPETLSEFLNKNPCEWKPENPPQRQFYHAITRGLYVAEILRRVDGRAPMEFVQQEILDKIGETSDTSTGFSFHVGCPNHLQKQVMVHEPIQSRLYVVVRAMLHFLLPQKVLEFFYDKEMDLLNAFELDIIRMLGEKITHRAFSLFSDVGLSAVEMANSHEFRSIPLLSATGISNATTLARIGKEIIADDCRFLSRKGFQKAICASGPTLRDDILCRTITLSDCGWGLDRFEAFGCPGWIGWAGMGGSLFVFEPKTQSVFAYVVNGLSSQQFKARGVRLLREFHRAVQDQAS